jgi:hypothetical protein
VRKNVVVDAVTFGLTRDITSIGGLDPIAPVSQAPLRMRDERQHSQKHQGNEFVLCSRGHRLHEMERVKRIEPGASVPTKS